ncbi:10335_t:CDS:1, partial [Acaulospora morrowiae]
WSSEVSADVLIIHEYIKHLIESQPWLARPSFTPEYWKCNESENVVKQHEKKKDDDIKSYKEIRGKNKRKKPEDSNTENEDRNCPVSRSNSEFELCKRSRIPSDSTQEFPTYDSHNLNGHSWAYVSLQNCKRSLSFDSPSTGELITKNITPYTRSSSENTHYSFNEQSSSSTSNDKLSFSTKYGESLSNVTNLNIFNFEQTIYNPHFNHLLWDQGLVDRLSDNGWFDDLVYSLGMKSKSLLKEDALWNAQNFELLSQSTEDDTSLTVLFFPNHLAGSLNDIIKMLKIKGITCDMKKIEMGARLTKKAPSGHTHNLKNCKSKKGKGAERTKSTASTISSTRTLYLLYPQNPECDVTKFHSRSVQLFLKKFPGINKVHVWETRENCIMNFEKLFSKLRSERELEAKLHRTNVHYQCYMNPVKEWSIMNFVVFNYNNKIDSIYKTLRESNISEEKVDDGMNYEEISLFIKVQHSIVYFDEDVVEKLAKLYSPPTSTIFEYNWEIKCPYVLIQSGSHLVALNKFHDYLENYVTPCGRINSVVLMHIVAKAVIQGRYYGFKVKTPCFDDCPYLDNYNTLPVHFAETDNNKERPFILMMAYDKNMV